MNITEDTILDFSSEPGQAYIFSASGDFGGGTVAMQWFDHGNWTTFEECELSTAATRVVYAPTNAIRVVAAGTSAPNISTNVVPAEGSSISSTKVRTIAAYTGSSFVTAPAYASQTDVPFDDGGFTVGEDLVSDGQIVIPATGWYSFYIRLSFYTLDYNSGDNLYFWIIVNGDKVRGSGIGTPASGMAYAIGENIPIYLEEGQAVKVAVENNLDADQGVNSLDLVLTRTQ